MWLQCAPGSLPVNPTDTLCSEKLSLPTHPVPMGPPAQLPGEMEGSDTAKTKGQWIQSEGPRRPCGHLRTPTSHAPDAASWATTTFDDSGSFDTILPSLTNVRIEKPGSKQSQKEASKHSAGGKGLAGHKSKNPTFLCPNDHRQYLTFRNRVAPAHLCAELIGAVMSVVGFCIGFPGCLACIVASCSSVCAACTSVHFSLTLYLTLVCVSLLFSVADLAALAVLISDKIKTTDCKQEGDSWQERQRRLQQGAPDSAGVGVDCGHALSVMEWWLFSLGVIIWCMIFAVLLACFRLIMLRKVRSLLHATPRKMKQVLVPKAGIRLVKFEGQDEPQIVVDKQRTPQPATAFMFNDDDGGVLQHVTDDDMRRAARSIQTSARGFLAARRLRHRRALAMAGEKALKSQHRKAMRSVIKRAKLSDIELPVVRQCALKLKQHSSACTIQSSCRGFVAQRLLARRRVIVERLARSMSLKLHGDI